MEKDFSNPLQGFKWAKRVTSTQYLCYLASQQIHQIRRPLYGLDCLSIHEESQHPYYPTVAEPKFSGIDYQEKHANENYRLQSLRAATDFLSLFFCLFFQNSLKKPLVSHLSITMSFGPVQCLECQLIFISNDSCPQTPGSSVSAVSLSHSEFLEVGFTQVLQ